MNLEYNQLKLEFEELKADFVKYKLRTDELTEYNTKLPHDINKYLKMIRNDIEDLRDYIDRIDNTYNKKSNKHELTKLKNKVKLMEDFYINDRTKKLDLENDIINIKITLHNNDISLKSLNDMVSKKSISTQDKKLKSDINNTKYSIKKLLIKQSEGTITDKELERLKDKQLLLTQLHNK